MKVKSLSRVQLLATPWTAAYQAINKIKNILEGTNSRITEAEDRISEVEHRMVEINESERKKENRIKRNEDNLRDLWDNVKRPTIES